MKQEQTDKLIKRGKAARILGVSDATVTIWANKGKLPVAQILGTGERRYSQAECERIAAELRPPQ